MRDASELSVSLGARKSVGATYVVHVVWCMQETHLMRECVSPTHAAVRTGLRDNSIQVVDHVAREPLSRVEPCISAPPLKHTS